MKWIKDDIDKILEDKIFVSDNLNACFLITGASGLIGSYCVNTLMEWSLKNKGSCKVIAVVHSKRKGEEYFNHYLKCSNFKIVEHNIIDNFILNNIDYIIHTAAITDKKSFKERPVDVCMNIINGTFNILELAKENNVKKVLLLSTALVYGDSNGDLLSEEYTGKSNIWDYCNCYAESKKMMEMLAASYAKQYGIKVNIVRLFTVFGITNLIKSGNFYSDFIWCALNNKDILILGNGEEIRNLCYVTDVITGMFYVLLNGINGEAYNIGNAHENMSMKEFAVLLKKAFYKNKFQIKILGEERKSNIMLFQKPSLNKLQKLGWNSKVTIMEGLQKVYLYYIQELGL